MIGSRWSEAEITERDGTPLASARGRVWRLARSRPGPGGQTYDHQGMIRHTDEVETALRDQQNRVLSVGGESYRVVDAIVNTSLGYLDLALIRVLADG